jgi:type I restriction enzyme M protein
MFVVGQGPGGIVDPDEINRLAKRFVDCYLPGKDRAERVETERFRAFPYAELVARDKANLDITWLRDKSLEDADALLPPEVIAQEIVDDLQAALAEFAAIADALSARTVDGPPTTGDRDPQQP